MKWSSESVVTGIILLVVFLATVITDQLNGTAPVPDYMAALLGASSTAFFAAMSSNHSKRVGEIASDAAIAKSRATDINETAIRAEAKADQLAKFAREEHPDNARLDEPPMTDHGGDE